MAEARSKQEEMMRLFEVLEEIRPEGKKRRGHEGHPPHGGKGKGRCGHDRSSHGEEGRCGCGHGRPPHGPEGHGIHPSSKKLLCILLQEGNLNQRNIANMMNVTAQAVSEMIKKLEAKELITKENGEINNENIISLTEKGREIAEHIDKQTKEYAEKLFRDFTDEECQILHDLMEKLYKNRSEIEV